jgi:hypothetical protein
MAAAGDIACAPETPVTPDQCQMAATAALVRDMDPDVVAALGDLQYERGAATSFASSWKSSWGALEPKVRPAVGNHEYGTPGAAGYWAYWGSKAGQASKGWYSYAVGSWHVVVLNSNCSAVGCDEGSEQMRWLKSDLADHRARCTLAYWHHPRYTSGLHGPDTSVDPLWKVLDEAGADIVLSGHDHHYERFAPQAAGSALDPHGIRQFVVGTGGRSLYPMIGRSAHSEAGTSSTFGALKLTLRQRGYEWRFVPADGKFADSGTAACTAS